MGAPCPAGRGTALSCENDAGVSPKMALAPADLTPKVEASTAEARRPRRPDRRKSRKTSACNRDHQARHVQDRRPDERSPRGSRLQNCGRDAGSSQLSSGRRPIAPGMDEPKPPRSKPRSVRWRLPAASRPAEGTGPRVSRFTLLAASLALAAALGGMAGALRPIASGSTRSGSLRLRRGELNLDEIQALKENVVQARVELAALKVSIDSANRDATAQFTRIGERITSASSDSGRTDDQAQQSRRDARIAFRAATELRNRRLRARPRRRRRMGKTSRRNRGSRMGRARCPSRDRFDRRQDGHYRSRARRSRAGPRTSGRNPQAGWPLGGGDLRGLIVGPLIAPISGWRVRCVRGARHQLPV